jgi:hypothetical protein
MADNFYGLPSSITKYEVIKELIKHGHDEIYEMQRRINVIEINLEKWYKIKSDLEAEGFNNKTNI